MTPNTGILTTLLNAFLVVFSAGPGHLAPAAARLSSDDAIRLLRSDLSEADERERRRDLALLARYREPDAVNALMDSATKDPDPGLREYAVELLAQ